MAIIQEISGLCLAVNNIIKHQRQLEEMRGETFNIFSVLKFERKENRAHSAFITELLNPNGSHRKGTVFLNRFLNLLEIGNHVDLNKASVSNEFHLGFINNEEFTGGRADIFIHDTNGGTIIIENKITTGDQESQIKRYCNHNKNNNKVYYLTLHGEEPSSESKIDCLSGEDYYLISYKEHIKSWLELCLKEAADAPMLRESIKQYLILIKNMTSTPDNQIEKDVVEAISQNFEAAVYIRDNMLKVKQSVGDLVRSRVFEKVKQKIPGELTIEIGNSITARYAQIWIWHKEYTNGQLCFGIESFNGGGHDGGNLFIGIFNNNAQKNSYTEHYIEQPLDFWYNKKFLLSEDSSINFGDDEFIKKILQNKDAETKLINIISDEILSYLDYHKDVVLRHLEIIKGTAEKKH